MKNIIKQAQDLFYRLDDNRYAFKPEVISSDNELYDILSDVIYQAEIRPDYAYNWMIEVLDMLEDADLKPGEALHDDIIYEYSESVTPVYNSELLEWLAASMSHISWVEEALSNYGWAHGDNSLMQMIMAGYEMAWQSYATEVLEALDDYQHI